MRVLSRSERVAAFFLPRTPQGDRRGTAVDRRQQRFASAQASLSAFYACIAFFAANHLFTWRTYLEVTTLTPRWPVFWLRWVDLSLGVPIILWFHLLGGLLAVAFSGSRVARILVFVSYLEFLALRFSFGSINNGDHLGLLICFVLIWLPAGWRSFPNASRGVRAATLLVFSGTQAFIMLTYSMSGLWKAGGVIEQLLKGETSYLAPTGLARQLAAKLLTAADLWSLLGPWFIEHYWIGWPLMIGAIYLELFALWVVFRPTLHRVWGLGLILLHLFTHLTMSVGFPQHVLWLGLFFVLSPFRPARADWRQAARDLPLIGGRLPGRWIA